MVQAGHAGACKGALFRQGMHVPVKGHCTGRACMRRKNDNADNQRGVDSCACPHTWPTTDQPWTAAVNTQLYGGRHSCGSGAAGSAHVFTQRQRGCQMLCSGRPQHIMDLYCVLIQQQRAGSQQGQRQLLMHRQAGSGCCERWDM